MNRSSGLERGYRRLLLAAVLLIFARQSAPYYRSEPADRLPA